MIALLRRTIIVVSYHLPIIANSDLIIVVRQGSIVETGTHLKFMRKGGVYPHFWEEQVGKVIPTKGPDAARCDALRGSEVFSRSSSLDTSGDAQNSALYIG